MLTVEMYARIKALMCAGHRNCDRCELRRRGRETMTVSDEPKMAKWCEIFAIRYPAEAVKLGVIGGVVFTATAWLFTSVQDRLSSGPVCKAAPVVSAFGLYLAAQCFAGILL